MTNVDALVTEPHEIGQQFGGDAGPLALTSRQRPDAHVRARQELEPSQRRVDDCFDLHPRW